MMVEMQITGLGLTLKGSNGPASAIGAKVVVTAGGKKQVLVNQWATSYLSIMIPVFISDWAVQKQLTLLEI